MEKNKLPQALLDHLPWEKETNPIWLSSSFTLHRNLSRYFFPPKLDEQQMQQIAAALKEPLLKSPLLKSPVLLKAEETSVIDKEYLYEHFLSVDGFQNTLAGQGFIVDDSGHFMAQLNVGDHLQLHLIDCEGSWEKTWNQLNQMETEIGSALDFAFSPKFGYLTSEPALCGTGLIVQAHLHLPALIHTRQLQEALLKQKEEDLAASGMGGAENEFIGDIVVISNAYTLGVNEENIIHSVESLAMKLMALEKTLRAHLQHENNAEIKDLVSRSFGLLLHSYQLQTKEALDALSLMKLAINLDWVAGMTEAQINALFFQCRRAHLLHLLGEQQQSDPQEIARKRAEFLHKHMPGVTLKFET
jgi:protein arginine kinase